MDYVKSALGRLPVRFIELLVDNNRRMFYNLDSYDLFSSILDTRFSPRFIPKMSLLFIADSNDDTLKLVAQKGIEEAAIRKSTITRGEGFVGKIAEQGKIYVSDQPEDVHSIFQENSGLAQQVGTAIGLPLKAAGKVIGVLNFFLEGMAPCHPMNR